MDGELGIPCRVTETTEVIGRFADERAPSFILGALRFSRPKFVQNKANGGYGE